MKKLVTLIAALILCFALCISASAYTASEALNASNAPTGTTETTYGNRTVTAEVYPAGTTFSTGKYVSGKDFMEFTVYGPNNTYVAYCYPGSSFTLPADGQVYYFSMMDGYSFTTEDAYVTSGAAEPAAPAAPQYSNYTVLSGYSMTYFYKAYAEDAIPVTAEGFGAEYLIPLNVQSGSKFGFGGMDGFASPTSFSKVTYDAATGTITDRIGIPLEVARNSYGDPEEVLIDELVRAAEGVYGNAIVFSGQPDDRSVYNAIFLIQLDGQEPAAPAPAPVESFTDVAEEDTFYDAIDYVTKRGLMDGASDTAFERKASVSNQSILDTLEQVSGSIDAAKEWAAEQALEDTAAATREDVITMLWLAKGQPYAEETVLDSFADAATISAESRAAMAWAVEAGIIKGYSNGHLGAQVQLTRGAFAAVLHRYLGK